MEEIEIVIEEECEECVVEKQIENEIGEPIEKTDVSFENNYCRNEDDHVTHNKERLLLSDRDEGEKDSKKETVNTVTREMKEIFEKVGMAIGKGEEEQEEKVREKTENEKLKMLVKTEEMEVLIVNKVINGETAVEFESPEEVEEEIERVEEEIEEEIYEEIEEEKEIYEEIEEDIRRYKSTSLENINDIESCDIMKNDSGQKSSTEKEQFREVTAEN